MYSILCVDDEPIIRELISLFLPKFGEFSIDLAEEPDTGLMMHQEKKYDAIISDFDMPGSNGISFLINLRSSGDKTPFILFTGKSREEIVVDALNWGADHYLHKSGSTDQFRELAHVTIHAIQRHQSIEEVKRSRQEMKDIISHLPDPTFAINTNGTVIAWNEAMVTLTGVDAESMLGKGDYAYAIPFFGEKRPLLLNYLLSNNLPEPEKYQKVVRNHTGITGTCSILIDGKERIFWIKATLLRDSEGNITGAIESLRDTTERVRLLRSIRDSRRNLENIINHLPDATFVLDHSKTVLAWNKEMERITGVPQGAAIGNNDGIHVVSLHGDRQKTLADHLLSGSKPSPEDYEFLNFDENSITGLSDGRFLTKDPGSYLKTASVLHDTSGEIFGVIETIRDVTPLRTMEKELLRQQEALTQSYEELGLAQEELRESYQTLAEWQLALEESELKYRTLVENSNDGVFIIQDYRILYMNPTCADMTGYGEGDLYRMEIWDIILPEDRESMIQSIETSIREKERSFRHTARILSRTGGVKTVEFAFGIVEYKGKEALLGRGRDISEKIRIEQALERANKKLHLMSGVTRHDIKNHLTSLLGALSLAGESDLSAETRHLINLALNAAKFIDRDISFTSTYQDIGSAAPEWMSIQKEFLAQSSLMQSHGVTFFSTIPASIEIYVDSLFPKVCYNLIENAIRHGEISQITLSSEEKNGSLYIYVSDDGTGIPEEEKSKIFLRGHGKNTGMGLFLSRDILDITDISIYEIGKEGCGAMFQLSIPPGGYRYGEEIHAVTEGKN